MAATAINHRSEATMRTHGSQRLAIKIASAFPPDGLHDDLFGFPDRITLNPGLG